MSAWLVGFGCGILAGVLLTKGAAWVGAKARIIEVQDACDRRLEDERQLQRWREQALLRGEGIELAVVKGIGEAGAVTTDATVLPIARRRTKGESA